MIAASRGSYRNMTRAEIETSVASTSAVIVAPQTASRTFTASDMRASSSPTRRSSSTRRGSRAMWRE